MTAAVLGLLLTSACQSRIAGRFVATTPPPHAVSAHEGEDVQLLNDTHPDRPYVIVGQVEERVTEGDVRPRAALMWKMREEGGAAGCDAVAIAGRPEERTHGAIGACIVYTDEAAVASARR